MTMLNRHIAKIDVMEPTAHVARAHGAARIIAAVRHGKTLLTERYTSQPYRLLVPTPADDEPLTAVLSNLSGGMLNGDIYDVALSLKPQASLLFTGQAAEKIYRAADRRMTRVCNTAHVGQDACLEWLPQGSIQFDGARLDRTNIIRCESTSRVIAGEILYLGRAAMGERLTCGILRDNWALFMDDKLVWQDRMILNERTMRSLDDPGAFNGATATAILLCCGPHAVEHLDAARDWMSDAPSLGGATMVNGVLLMRWLSDDAQALRDHFGHVAGRLRYAVMGRPSVLPRIWSI